MQIIVIGSVTHAHTATHTATHTHTHIGVHITYWSVHVCVFVGCCLATKVFIGKLPAGYTRPMGDHRVGQ